MSSYSNRLERIWIFLFDITDTLLSQITAVVIFAPRAIAVVSANYTFAQALAVKFQTFGVSAITPFIVGFLFVVLDVGVLVGFPFFELLKLRLCLHFISGVAIFIQ